MSELNTNEPEEIQPNESSLPEMAWHYSRRGLDGRPALRGLRVFPCLPRDKKPKTPNGLLDATDNPFVVPEWWERTPDANIGIAVKPSGLLVLDIDPRNGGDVSELPPYPATLEAITGGGGRHIYFRHPGGDFPATFAPGIDIKSNGYVIAPPSVHETGQRYEWDGIQGFDTPIADCPEWLTAKRKRTGETSVAAPLEAKIPEGQRNNTLTSFAGTMRRRGLSADEILPALRAINEARCALPLPDAEIDRIAKGIERYKAPAQGAEPTGVAALIKKDGPVPTIAHHLLRQHRFARDGGGRLYIWADGRYQPTADDVIAREAQEFLRGNEILSKWQRSTSSDVAEYIRAGYAPDLLDAPPETTLCLRNGLLDVTTLELRPHDPEYLSPVQLPVSYDRGSDCPRFRKFLGEVLPNDSHDVVYRMIGLCLTPITKFQTAFLLIGEGSNGKSVLLDLVREIAGPGNVSHVSLHDIERDKFAGAQLYGKLVNIYADLDKIPLPSTRMFKNLTGGDSISAERKYEHAFTFSNRAKLLFSANYYPRTPDTSDGFFRRWIVLPFDRRISGDDVDPDLLAKLTTDDERSGILNRAVLALRELLTTNEFRGSASTARALDDWRDGRDIRFTHEEKLREFADAQANFTLDEFFDHCGFPGRKSDQMKASELLHRWGYEKYSRGSERRVAYRRPRIV